MEVSNVKGVLCGCVKRKFPQREFKIRVDWLPTIMTEREVAEPFQRYGNVIKVYKEMAPQVRNYPRYWGGGGTFIVCLVPEDEEVVKDIADFQDVEIRGKIYSMSAVVLGLPPRCHRCKIRGHIAYQCTACSYCGSDTHTFEEHSAENARRRGFAEVLKGTNMAEFEMEEEGNGQGNERGHQVIDTQPGPLTQMLRDEESQDEGGEKEVNKGEAAEGEKKGEHGKERAYRGVSRGRGFGKVGGIRGGDEWGRGIWGRGEGGRRGRERGLGRGRGEGGRRTRVRRRKKRYDSIGEDGMSRSRSSSGERSGKRAHTLRPSPSRLQGGGMGERKGVLKTWSYRRPATPFLSVRC